LINNFHPASQDITVEDTIISGFGFCVGNFYPNHRFSATPVPVKNKICGPDYFLMGVKIIRRKNVTGVLTARYPKLLYNAKFAGKQLALFLKAKNK